MTIHPTFTSGRKAETQSPRVAAPAAQKKGAPRARRGNRIVAAPSLAPEMPGWAAQSTQTDASLRRAIRRMVEKQFACILAKDLGTDPILGDWFAGTSIASKIQKAHGALLPRTLGMALEANGLKVWHEPVISLSAMSLALSKGNTISKLDGLSLPPCGADRTLYAVDLVVHCPKTGWTGAMDGKRGGGQSDSTAKSEIVEYIRATYLFLPTWARENGLDVRAHDARVIDFYGRSSYDDELAIRGWQLDDYFGCDVEAMLAWFNACFREAADEVLTRLQRSGDMKPAVCGRRDVEVCEKDWFCAPKGSGLGGITPAFELFASDPGDETNVVRAGDAGLSLGC
ncbi:MAG: hypothetical protein HC788_10325 [Sphingopyxis sp.]|nr:hypothetical protein [Sphingopyxis sp.]